jgi:hypothetical protein
MTASPPSRAFIIAGNVKPKPKTDPLTLPPAPYDKQPRSLEGIIEQKTLKRQIGTARNTINVKNVVF